MFARSCSIALVTATLLAPTTVRADDVTRADVAIDAGDPRGIVSLVSSASSVAPGSSFDVGVRFELDDGWHVYFRNPGEAALGTELTFRAERAQVGDVAWPVPTRHLDPSGTIATFGYERDVLFLAPVTVDADANRAVVLSVVADFLICRVECIPGRVTLTRTIPVSERSVAVPDEELARFVAARAAMPNAPARAGATVTLSLDPVALAPSGRSRGSLTIACDSPTCVPFRLDGVRPENVFFPDRIASVRMRATGLRAVGPRSAVLEIALEASPDDPGRDQALTGIVALPTERGTLALEVSVPLPRARAGVTASASEVPGPSTPSAPSAPSSLGLVLLFAFLGGLVLNGMPCVLPVLALKVFALARASGDERATRARHAAAYALGVLSTFLALALVVVSLRSAGASVGWGMQLQEPRFVALLAALVVVSSLGLFGVYTLGVDATALAGRVDRGSGAPRAFGEGVLTVALATPCSAPFLGSAVGFALTQGSALIVVVFVVVGLGLATPFVVLSLVPAASRLVPRPGAWMHAVEQTLGFALLGTAVWLVWVVGTLSGVDGMAKTLALVLLASFVVWAASSVRSRGPVPRRSIRAVCVVVLGVGSFALLRDLAVIDASTRTGAASAAWSDEAVRSHLDAGVPVFVDFTASWCISCQANERLVLGARSVRDRFAEAGVVTLIGDYTQRDARIAAVLERHRRAGVPLYLVYSPARPDTPEVLPELLTQSIVLDAIARAEGGSR